MIVLITGMPGSGKTSLLVSMLMSSPDFQNRQIYVSGIKDLDLGNENIHILDEGLGTEPTNSDERADNWQDWLPDSSILVIDEAQRIFRPRSISSSVPAHVSALETHRHKGVDIFILTQHPRLLDQNVKSLVGKHLNIKMTPLGIRKIQEWTECANPDSATDARTAMQSTFKLKSESFGKYKSAEEHTKLKQKRHWIFYFAIALIPIIPLVLWFAYYSYSNVADITKEKKDNETKIEATSGTQVSTTSFTNNIAETPAIAKGTLPEHYVPSIAERPETKPMYNNIKQVQSFEFPNMCIENKSTGDCRCYTHQATLIKEIPKEFCKEYIENGIFNPYKARDDLQRAQMQPTNTG